MCSGEQEVRWRIIYQAHLHTDIQLSVSGINETKGQPKTVIEKKYPGNSRF